MKQTPLPQIFLLSLLYVSMLTSCITADEPAFYRQIAIVPDTLSIDNSTEVIITCPKGTVVSFDKGSFARPDGSAPKGPVSIVIKECYTDADMIRENLSTLADGLLLETRGMVNIAAYADGQELKLKEGKEFIIHFPKKTEDRNKPMNLFYGEKSDTGGLNWKIDTNSLVRLATDVISTMWPGTPKGDSSYRYGLQIAGNKPMQLDEYINRNLDIDKLGVLPSPLIYFDVAFILDTKGKIKVSKIEAFRYVDTGSQILPDLPISPYLSQFMEQIELMPLYSQTSEDEFIPFDAHCAIVIGFSQEPMAFENNENYSEQFRKKYAAFRESSIAVMNEEEFRFYTFSASKLGWINCDYYWGKPGKKINFAVKTDPDSSPNIKLIFKNVQSIMEGQKQGGNMVFPNIPAGEEVKIVAISFKGNKPLLAIAHTKTSNEIFKKLDYKEFSLNDLEKALSEQ